MACDTRRPNAMTVATLIGVAFNIGGCPPAGDSGDGADLSSVSFARDVQPIFTSRCIDCHAPGGLAQREGITMDLRSGQAWASIVNQPATQASGRTRIIPGDADASYLIEKVSSSNPEVGARMPLLQTRLTDSQIETIRAWVEQGALDN